MKKLLIPFLLALIFFPQIAEAQSQRNPCIYLSSSNTNCIPVGSSVTGVGNSPMPVGGLATAAAPTYVEGMMGGLSFDLSGRLRTSGSFTPSGTQDINLTQILGAAPSLANPLWVFPATGATFPISAVSLPLPTLAATSTKQSDGSQKSQIVDGSGNVIGATSNAIDVNIKSGSSGLPTGASTAANQAATQAPVAPATATATKSDLVGCQATSAGITPTTGQQAAVDCDLNNNLLVSSGGAPNLAIAQVSIATSDTLAVAARSLRRSITIQNITGTQQVYCNQTTATTANGVLLPAVAGSSITLNTTSAVRCIAVTGAQTVAIVETF